MKNLVKLLWVGLFLMGSVAASAADFSLNPARDFGAIRRINPTDYDGLAVVRETGAGLSSDTSEAFRAALEVFSKAHVQSNYVATSTFVAHVTDNSDVHGCTAIASASAVADALSACNASDALNLRLDGSWAMTGNLKFSGNYGVLQSTSDGADSGFVFMCGGGALSVDRGGYISVQGNEHAQTGQIVYRTGNVSGGDHIFFTGNGAERMRLTYGGNVGIGSTSPGRNLVVKDADGSVDMSLQAGNNTGYSTLYFGDSDSETAGYIQWNHTKNSMALGGGNVLIGTTTDDGTNKLQVNGPVYVASYVSALGYIDRTEAPDTLDEAYAIVNSHEVTPDGNLDHSKLHPAAWGRKVEIRPTGRMIEQVIDTPVEAEPLAGEGEITKEPETALVEEIEQVVVPDQSGRDLSMVISAQALVIKDLTKRIEALETR